MRFGPRSICLTSKCVKQILSFSVYRDFSHNARRMACKKRRNSELHSTRFSLFDFVTYLHVISRIGDDPVSPLVFLSVCNPVNAARTRVTRSNAVRRISSAGYAPRKCSSSSARVAALSIAARASASLSSASCLFPQDSASFVSESGCPG